MRTQSAWAMGVSDRRKTAKRWCPAHTLHEMLYMHPRRLRPFLWTSTIIIIVICVISTPPNATTHTHAWFLCCMSLDFKTITFNKTTTNTLKLRIDEMTDQIVRDHHHASALWFRASFWWLQMRCQNLSTSAFLVFWSRSQKQPTHKIRSQLHDLTWFSHSNMK